jgi:hypothetical protein
VTKTESQLIAEGFDEEQIGRAQDRERKMPH